MSYGQLCAALAAGRLVIVDGGTGTDIQTRGGGMNDDIWCAEANFTHPEVVQAVHEGYIAAGAELIVSNTYPTSPLLFDHLGRFDDVARYDARAAELARAAVAASGRQVPVAGSFSVMRPVADDGHQTRLDVVWPEAEARRLMAAKAAGQVAAGVDFILMEMMRETTYSVWGTEAAMATDLPVWVGIAAERLDGRLCGYSRPNEPLEPVIEALAALRPEAIVVMHTAPNDVTEVLELVKRHWDGPLGAAPEAGYFRMPDWVFDAAITPEVLVEFSERWVEAGVTILGGCCGTGPAHIAALHSRWAA